MVPSTPEVFQAAKDDISLPLLPTPWEERPNSPSRPSVFRGKPSVAPLQNARSPILWPPHQDRANDLQSRVSNHRLVATQQVPGTNHRAPGTDLWDPYIGHQIHGIGATEVPGTLAAVTEKVPLPSFQALLTRASSVLSRVPELLLRATLISRAPTLVIGRPIPVTGPSLVAEALTGVS